jgi:hypothetical protein
MKLDKRKRHPIWSWIIHTPWVLTVLAILGVIGFFASGAGNPILKRSIAHRLQAITGAQVEIDSLSIRWLALRATLHGVIVHGRETAGTRPLLSAREVRVGLRIDSFWGRKVSLDELLIRDYTLPRRSAAYRSRRR